MPRDEERERRRIRDRQRRQSMTLEQRERHLARRRKNYQLRRLRAETRRLDTTTATMSLEEPTIMINSTPEKDFQDDGLNPNNGFVQEKEKFSSECLDSMSLETLAQRSDNVIKKIRLSHVRSLARSLNRCGGGVGVGVGVGDARLQLGVGDNDSGRLTGGLRLNRIKRLARALNTANTDTDTDGESHQGTVLAFH
ncbi:uncharacterized protein LOC133794773 isoform X1 [Humulus lupulus]|uniref:uncharacterized protein LOC133794773 isoform X1 n=2 Tax=Humulus lupulus TaxID=3486 RepID=UPI002B410802|nr:uncharacterized protein LOC133794773 isoform X1 [Humulus lupulus]